MNATVLGDAGSEENIYGRFGVHDYVVFIVMLGVSTAIGVYFGCFEKSEKSTEEYLLGGRKMKTLPIAISLIASQLSGISIMATPAEMYAFGTQYWIVVPAMVIVVVVINYVIIPVFYNNQISNCYEYLEMRFSKEVRKVVTIAFLFGVYLILPVIVFIPALAFSQVTGVNIHLINAIVCAICVFYTMLGGIKAVVWTDVVQAGIMLGSCILVLVLGVQKVGGLDLVWEIAEKGNRLQLFNMTFDLTTRQTFWNALFGYFTMWCAYVGLNQSCVQRIVSVPSITHARNAIWLFCLGFIVIMSLNCLTGVVMYARFADCDPVKAGVVGGKPDKLMPYFVQDVVGHLKGMPGVFISCVFSAGLSTMSANLNSLSGILYEDYVRPLKLFKHTEVSANLAMKVLVVLSGAYCIAMGLVVENFAYILQMVMTIASVSQGATMGTFCLGMLYPNANKRGAMVGLVVSIGAILTIVVGQQIIISRGELHYEPLPTSIEGCGDFGFNMTLLMDAQAQTTPTPISDDSFSIFKISFPWLGAIGTVLVWIIGVPVSILTGGSDLKDEKLSRLISPVCHWMLPPEAFRTPIPMTDVVEGKKYLPADLEKSEFIWCEKEKLNNTEKENLSNEDTKANGN